MKTCKDYISKCKYDHICEWCNKNYNGIKKSRFCSRKCMYEWRKDNNWITSKCLHCNKNFKHRKNKKHPRTGKSPIFCSTECHQKSNFKKEQFRKRILENNPMNNQKSIDKIKETKDERYGDPHYNNPEKYIKTMLEKYGVKYGIDLPHTNTQGVRISKVQKKLYEQIKVKYPDALLEHYLPDILLSVDIFIPSENKVIECYGDWWHCNPKLYKEDYYHSHTHKTAKEIWEKDKLREDKIKNAGYGLEIIWECNV